MTTQELAHRLVELCRQGQFDAAQHELYSNDAKSVEPDSDMSGMPKVVHGMKAIVEKGQHFQKMVEAVHSLKVSDPIVSGNAIAFAFEMEVTMAGRGKQTLSEICVYETKDGKVVSEQFFW